MPQVDAFMLIQKGFIIHPPDSQSITSEQPCRLHQFRVGCGSGIAEKRAEMGLKQRSPAI